MSRLLIRCKGFMGLLFILIVVYIKYSMEYTHWIVSNKGKIHALADSIYSIKQPDNLYLFLDQERKVNKLHCLKQQLVKERVNIDVTKDVKDLSDIDAWFYKKDKDCILAEKPLSQLDLYVSTLISPESLGIDQNDHIPFQTNSKHFSLPDCSKVADLSYNIRSLDYLESVQKRNSLSIPAETALKVVLPFVDSLTEYGHVIYEGLVKNQSSWILYDMATFFWRIKGDGPRAVECIRRSLYYSPNKYKPIALVNLANVLTRSGHAADALEAILLIQTLNLTEGDFLAPIPQNLLPQEKIMKERIRDVIKHKPFEDFLIPYMLGNIYALLANYTESVASFRQALRLKPGFKPAIQKLHAVLCHDKLIKALEYQHDTLQSTLENLQAFQKKHEIWTKLYQQLTSEVLPMDVRMKKLTEYEEYLVHNRQKMVPWSLKSTFDSPTINADELDELEAMGKRENQGHGISYKKITEMKKNYRRLSEFAPRQDKIRDIYEIYPFDPFEPAKFIEQFNNPSSDSESKNSHKNYEKIDESVQTDHGLGGGEKSVNYLQQPFSPTNTLHKWKSADKQWHKAKTHEEWYEPPPSLSLLADRRVVIEAELNRLRSTDDPESTKLRNRKRKQLKKVMDELSREGGDPLRTLDEFLESLDNADNNDDLDDPLNKAGINPMGANNKRPHKTFLELAECGQLFRHFFNAEQRIVQYRKGPENSNFGRILSAILSLDQNPEAEINNMDVNNYFLGRIPAGYLAPEARGWIHTISLLNEKQGIYLPHAADQDESTVEINSPSNALYHHPLPWNQPVCSQVINTVSRKKLQECTKCYNDMVKDLSKRIAKFNAWYVRQPFTYLDPLLLTDLLSYIGTDLEPSEHEVGQRIFTALNMGHEKHWALYLLASLYWRTIGNIPEAIDCMQRSLYYCPSRHRSIVLYNFGALLAKSLGALDHAKLVLEEAHLMAKFDSRITLLLAHVNYLVGNLTSASHFYKETLFLYAPHEAPHSINKDALIGYEHVGCRLAYPETYENETANGLRNLQLLRQEILNHTSISSFYDDPKSLGGKNLLPEDVSDWLERDYDLTLLLNGNENLYNQDTIESLGLSGTENYYVDYDDRMMAMDESAQTFTTFNFSHYDFEKFLQNKLSLIQNPNVNNVNYNDKQNNEYGDDDEIKTPSSLHNDNKLKTANTKCLKDGKKDTEKNKKIEQQMKKRQDTYIDSFKTSMSDSRLEGEQSDMLDSGNDEIKPKITIPNPFKLYKIPLTFDVSSILHNREKICKNAVAIDLSVIPFTYIALPQSLVNSTLDQIPMTQDIIMSRSHLEPHCSFQEFPNDIIHSESDRALLQLLRNFLQEMNEISEEKSTFDYENVDHNFLNIIKQVMGNQLKSILSVLFKSETYGMVKQIPGTKTIAINSTMLIKGIGTTLAIYLNMTNQNVSCVNNALNSKYQNASCFLSKGNSNEATWIIPAITSLYWRSVGEFHEAIKCLRAALMVGPLDIYKMSPLLNLANLAHTMGNEGLALLTAFKTISLNPKSPIAHLTTANILAAQGKLQESLVYYISTLCLQDVAIAKERLKSIICFNSNLNLQFERFTNKNEL